MVRRNSVGKYRWHSDDFAYSVANVRRPWCPSEFGVFSCSATGSINLIGTPYVSSSHTISEPHSKQGKGEASVTSSLTKLSGKTSVSSGVLIGVPKSRNPNAEVSVDPFLGSSESSSFTVTFSTTSVLSDLDDSSVCFPEDRFRFHGYEEFDAACDLKGDLYDYIGHIKLVNGQVLVSYPLYLWDKAASEFCERFKASGGTARVILVTTLNPKRLGGALALSSMAPSRVFLDTDVQATRDYLNWMNTNLDVANRVNADIVTKTETVTIGELFSYMKQEDAKVAWFECIATVGDVVHGSSWYYIGLWETSIVGVAQYLTKISVYDNDDQASFVLLGDAGHELSGKKASELVEDYFEANEDVGGDHLVPVPQALIDTIGQTRKFVVKVSKHNLTGQTQSLTVTKVLTLEVPEVEANLEGNVAVPDTRETLDKEDADDDPSTCFGSVKRAADKVEADDPKRARSG
ncbi:BnaC05g50090D [Brassica napus]|uniref:BnaC05g50090D protein n=1 Tax=Brassica napus TaxID=3708 RepID=A0A078J3Z8_BRANA|nr:BnaC05g50090D [Brassica napus]